MAERSREDVIRIVQGLWRKADDPATPEGERNSLIEKARDLMARHAIDEMVLDEAANKADKDVIIMGRIRVADDDKDDKHVVSDQRMYLANSIAVNNRCRCVITHVNATVSEDGRPIKSGTEMIVVGYRHDVDTVRILYTELATDMILAMMLEPTDHMTVRERNNYNANFCDGYATRIDGRLRSIKVRVEAMAGDTNLLPVLRSKEVAVLDEFNKRFPKLGQQKVSRYHNDPSAKARGAAAAEKADIGGTKVGGGGPKGAIG